MAGFFDGVAADRGPLWRRCDNMERDDTVKQRSQVRLALLGLMAVAAVSAANAEPYPSGMIRIIVPSAAGTPPSIMARLVANALSESEGWRVIVEDKPGAIGAIGLAEVLKQPADGYTIAAIALPTSAAPALLPNMSFRLDTDFAPVIKLASAVTGPARLPALPDVPTVAEAGFPDLIIQDWFGLLVKSGTPNEIVVRLNAAVNKALAKPQLRDAITRMAAEPAGGTPAEFGQFLNAQIAHWGKVVKESGIKMQP